jgi:hypothetical protein
MLELIWSAEGVGEEVPKLIRSATMKLFVLVWRGGSDERSARSE